MNWSIQENAKIGDKIYGDREFTFTTFPTELTGAEWIRTACDSKASQSSVVEFTAAKSITVYIALDTRVVPTNLEWIGSWTKNGMKIETSNAVAYDVYEKNYSAGETVTLGTNGPPTSVVMYSAFVKKLEVPKLDGTLIKSLARYDEENYSAWSIQKNLQVDSVVYGDRDFTIASLPNALKGAEWISTSCDSKFWDNTQAEFIAGADITVSILMDSRSTVSEWLSGWKDTGLTITTSNDVTFKVLQAEFNKGDIVTLGTNGPSSGVVNYFAAVSPQEETPQIVLGDINADGKIDGKDVQLLKEYLLGKVNTLSGTKAADMNNDGIISSYDLVILKRNIL